MIRYLLVVDGQIRFSFFFNEIDELVKSYYNYKKYYKDVIAFEIGYAPETEKFYFKKLKIEKGVQSCIS